MGRSTENSNKRSNSASPDKPNKTPKLHDDGCSLSITRLIEQKFKELSETFGNKLTAITPDPTDFVAGLLLADCSSNDKMIGIAEIYKPLPIVGCQFLDCPSHVPPSFYLLPPL